MPGELFLPTHRAPTHPGEMLAFEFLEPLGITQADFADRIGISRGNLNTFVRGRRSLTPEMAKRLERALGVSAEFWMRLQATWDVWHVEHDRALAKKFAKIKPVPRQGAPLTI